MSSDIRTASERARGGSGLANGSNNHHYEMLRSHSMPNSLVTVNRFWDTKGKTAVPDQVALTQAFVQSIAQLGPLPDCGLEAPPN